MKRLGVFAGTFDPIHLGHTAFVEQAIEAHELETVLVLVEKKPRFKTCFANYEQRSEMVRLAIAENPKIRLYETNCDDFPITNCLPKIRTEYDDAKLFLLIGTDVAKHIKTWPNAGELLRGIELIIGQRQPAAPSSLKVRRSLAISPQTTALNPQVKSYITQNNLYK